MEGWVDLVTRCLCELWIITSANYIWRWQVSNAVRENCKMTSFLQYSIVCSSLWLPVTSPKVHWSEGSLVRKVTGPNSNPNPCPNPNRNPIHNPKVVFDLRNKETLNSVSYVHAVRPLRNSDYSDTSDQWTFGLVNRHPWWKTSIPWMNLHHFFYFFRNYAAKILYFCYEFFL